jgi:phosphohistidine phosphatase
VAALAILCAVHLYLIRHAEALSDGEDPRRPLTPAGVGDAERVARLLVRAGLPRPSEIRHSTQLRTRQTAACFGRAWGGGVPEREVEGLESLDDVHPIAHALADAPGDLALVGHLPHLPRLAALLLAGDPALDLIDLPPAGALCLLRTRGPVQPSWCLRWMVTPRLVT